MKSLSQNFLLGLAQLNPTIGDLNGNAKQILTAARQAAIHSAQLLLTPELSLCGYPPRDLLLNASFVASMETALQQLARDLPPQLSVLVGTVKPNEQAQELGGQPLFNSIVLLAAGKVQTVFYKRLLPTYDVFDEDRYFEPGLQSNAFTLTLEPEKPPHSERQESKIQNPKSKINIGVTICEDLWNDEEFWGKRNYPENPIGELVAQNVNLIVNLSASPYTVGKQRLRESMLQHSIGKHHLPIIYANQVGGNDDLIFDGSSVALNRKGEIIARACPFETDLLLLEFDAEKQDLRGIALPTKTTDKATKQEQTLPSSLTVSPFPVPRSPFPVRPSPIAPLPESEEAEIWFALVLGVRDYARKCGFSKVVIGLSGGIDSALVAAIATAALGPENVLGILMPSPYSSDHSVQDALALANNLGITTQILPIGDLMQGYDRTLKELFTGTASGVAEENIQSRIRGNLLMAIANKFGHLLLSTGNKSEMAVGYCTLYGDMNGGLAAIADVPKTRVYTLCHWLNTQSQALTDRQTTTAIPVIPPNILTKPPSAELKPDQVDQDSLPPYDILDNILYRLIEQHQSPAQIVTAGHEPVLVEKVARLVSRSEFKRRQAPPGLKITDRAFGTGWRMPIACKGLRSP